MPGGPKPSAGARSRDLHILSDPVYNFWKCPKKGFKNVLALFYYLFLTHLVLSDPLKLFQKSQ